MKCSTRCAALAALCAAVVSSAVASSEVDGGGSTGTTVREIRIHSHNDYAQKRPFWGAYEAGADSIEADVFLVDGELLVAHSRKGLKKENTLRRLYLEPLREVMRKNGGRARANGKPLQLVIDLKSGKPALDALLTLIEQEGFRECFDICKNPSAVRLSVGGDISEIKDFLSYPDFVFFSVPSSRKLDDGQYKRVSWISDYARILTKWRSGAMAECDKKKIRAAAARAHAKGVPYRLWGFPDNPEAWQLSRELGLDYINTDHPSAVAAFRASPDSTRKENNKGKQQMKTSSVFAALAAVCASFAWADTPRDVAPEGVFKDGSVILFIGDSITHGGRRGDMNHYIGHGYQAEIAARYLGYRPDKGLCFLNRALSGDTTEKLLKRWENDVFNLKFMEKGWQSPFPERTGTLKPDVVSLLVGINDFYQAKSGKMTLEKYAANLEMLVSSTLKKFPGVEMVLCEPFCLREPEKGQLAPWRKAARAVAERHNLCFVDFQKLFDETLVRENTRPGYWFWDGAHPTYAAHIRMADYWIEKVSEHHRRAGALK